MATNKIANFGLSVVLVLGSFSAPTFANEQIVGSGKITKESRKLGDYHAISISVTSMLDAAQGASEPLVLEGDDNVLKVIKTEVKDGVLYIDCDKNLLHFNKLSFKVKAPKLDALTLKGTGTASVASLNGPAFTLVSKGTGTCNMSGTVNKLSVDMSGTGTVQAEKLSAKNAVVSISGTGSVKLTATDTLDATIKGTGSIKYAGNPKVTQKILGVGSISKI